MDRSFYYDQSQIRGYDHSWMARDNLLALAQLAQDLHGSTLTRVSGLAATASTPTPNMMVSVAAGSIYSLADVDATAYGPLTSDTNQVLQQGILSTSTSLTFSTSGIPTTGYSQWALVEASFLQTDVIRSDDPNGGLLYFYNSANPSEPFEGPGNDGDTLPTVRLGTITLTIKYGTAATTGSEVPPSADAGAVGLYLVDLVYGQTQITQAEILTAGPLAGNNVPSNYPLAPFIAGLLGRPVVGSYAGNPNGEVAGTVWPNGGTVYAPNFCLDTANGSLYECTTAGPASSAVWLAIAGPNAIPSIAGVTQRLTANLTSAGNSVAFTADYATVAAALGGASSTLANFSQTLNIANTGIGGMVGGAAGANAFVSIYAAGGPSGTGIFGVATSTSTSSPTVAASPPAGYTQTALIGVWPTNATSQLVAGFVVDREFSYQSGVRVLTNGSATSATSISLSSTVPVVARAIEGIFFGEETSSVSSTSEACFGSTSAVTTSNLQIQVSASIVGGGVTLYGRLPLPVSQTVYYLVGHSTMDASLTITGYWI
jgi:hypothetical protein